MIYQPQLEKFEDNKLIARSVISVTTGNSTEPVFGVFCFKSQVETDRDGRMVTLTNITVNKVLYPDTQEEQKGKINGPWQPTGRVPAAAAASTEKQLIVEF